MQYIEKRNTFLSKNLLHQNHRRSTRPEECAICDFHFSFMGHLFRFKSRKAPQYKIKLCVDNSYPNGGDGARVSLGSVFLENIVALRPLVPLWHFPQLYRFIWKSKAVSDQRLNGVAKRKGNGKSWRPLLKRLIKTNTRFMHWPFVDRRKCAGFFLLSHRILLIFSSISRLFR